MVVQDAAPHSRLGTEAFLRWSATFFSVAVLLHNADHVRRGTDTLQSGVFWLGTVAIVIEVAVVVAVFAHDPLAPLAAGVVGFQLAAGYIFVHFTPARSWLSDTFLDEPDIDAYSWIAAGLETLAAAALGVAGLAALRRRGGLASLARRPPLAIIRWGRALAHPVVAVMTVGNAAILLASAVPS